MPWAAVIGSPVDHSLSPTLHRAAWDWLGISQEWEYRRIDCDKEGVEELLTSLDKECRGLSVTMPCKQAVIPYLDAIDPLAQALGSVNTVIHSGGTLTGFNTDVYGIFSAISQVRSQPIRSALVLGSGATAASTLAAIGNPNLTRIHVAARRFHGPHSLLTVAMRLGLEVDQIPLSDADRVIGLATSVDAVISTLPAGVADSLAARLGAPETPTPQGVLLDVIYSPLTTPLVAAWKDKGGASAHGLDMLAAQGIQQVKLMTGRDADLDVVRSALWAKVSS
ncbi:MAG: shikimate dehydrogenase [Actinomycetaceae bacterium]|nr:shikimate dehydrogenase [Actinomycetaceae bacterium]